MNARVKVLIAVVVPGVCKLLESDVAGRLACEYLLETLSKCDAAECKLVVEKDALASYPLEKYPSFAACSPEEFIAGDQDERELLVVDVRACISSDALLCILARSHEAGKCLRIVESSMPVCAARRDLRTLAVCFPSGHLRSALFKRVRTTPEDGLEQVLDTGVLAQATVVDGLDLDAASPAMLIDSYEDIAALERRVLFERARRAMNQGVRIRDPHKVYIRGDLSCGSGVEIDINVVVEGRVVLGDGVKIGANSIIRDARVGKDARIHPFSLVENSIVGSDSFVGPYGRVRPGSEIGDGVQIGNYVEIKNSRIGSGSRINHHTFIGDAILAAKVTIGAGTITCNHDGRETRQTIIERGAYIGSGCNLVAPLRIGEGAVIGAGSTITRDVPAAKLTLARSPQTTIENWQGPKARREEP